MKLLLVCSMLLLCGCVSEKTQLINAKGQVYHCDHWGLGIGAAVAMAAHADCMKKARAAGYSEAPK